METNSKDGEKKMKTKRHNSTLESLADKNNIEIFQCPEDYQLEGEYENGWYWWSCSPGCLPDGDPSGPFPTYREALVDATEGLDE